MLRPSQQEVDGPLATKLTTVTCTAAADTKAVTPISAPLSMDYVSYFYVLMLLLSQAGIHIRHLVLNFPRNFPLHSIAMELEIICVITHFNCWCSATHDESLQLLVQRTQDEPL